MDNKTGVQTLPKPSFQISNFKFQIQIFIAGSQTRDIDYISLFKTWVVSDDKSP